MLLFYLERIDGADDKSVFEYYYKLCKKQMFFSARSILSNDSDAEDAVHNAFLGIVKHIEVLRGASESDAKSYCLKAAKNAAADILRKNKSIPDTVSFEELTDVPDEKSLRDVLDNSEYKEILEAVKSMDDIYRDVLYMRYVMDMPVKKIADVLNRRVSTVKQQLVRGKKQLVLKLSEEVMTDYGE